MSRFPLFATHHVRIFVMPLLLTLSMGAWGTPQVFAQEGEEADPPKIVNGERLFLETRFAQLFKGLAQKIEIFYADVCT